MYKYRTRNNDYGFTIIELSIVIIISGLLLSMFLMGYRNYTADQKYKETLEIMVDLDGLMDSFYSNYGRYPCPADPSLPPDHPDFGMELPCGSGASRPNSACNDSGDGPRLSDTPAFTRSGVICSNVGTRDVNGDGENEYVLIGMLPFRQPPPAPGEETLHIFEEKNTIDGYKMRITYVVTEAMADERNTPLQPISPHWGAISLFDENGTNMSDPPSSTHYLFLSHGENTKGAFTLEGIKTENCVTGYGETPGLNDPNDPDFGGAIDLENENCDDNDGVFRNALKNLASGNNYFDDIIFNRNMINAALWRRVYGASYSIVPQPPCDYDADPDCVPPPIEFCDPLDPDLATDCETITPLYLTNTNTENVGVGINTPLSRLHVSGDINVSTKTLSQEGYCDPSRPEHSDDSSTASKCFNTELFTDLNDVDSGRVCPAGQIAVGFSHNTVICEDLFVSSPSADYTFNCDDDEFGQPQFPSGITYNRVSNTITAYGCSVPITVSP